VGALDEIAKFGPLLDDFFNEVMVMTPQEEVRAKRLGLLLKIFTEFSQIADFSEIVTAG
jgi:glycyl-tRNA synthetase beta chain